MRRFPIPLRRVVVALAMILILTGCLARRMHFIRLAAEQGRAVDIASQQRDKWRIMSVEDCRIQRAIRKSGMRHITILPRSSPEESPSFEFDEGVSPAEIGGFRGFMKDTDDVVERFRQEMLTYWDDEIDRERSRWRAIARRWLW